jgi:cyclopropane fatty-acyl-phospholipid synthase-like methyltransferase
MTESPFAASAARNTRPILEVLRREFRAASEVLEIGSGTGQHAVAFGSELDAVTWQTSDLAGNHAGINAWLEQAGVKNVRPPLALDVRSAAMGPASFDAVFSANTAHIMGIDAVRAMFALVGDVLRAAGVFCLYGPFRLRGRFNTASNEAFDRSLRERDSVMGIRDIEVLDEFGSHCGLHRRRLYAMPSNNFIGVWSRTGEL